VGTSGTDADVERAREAGARVGETVAVGANRAQQLASDAALTVKIKSKMTLDDTIDAADIDVDTTNGVVTLRGAVDTSQQQQRATQLARETEGVTSVVDQLTVQ
jgi:hyperosmotically inducible protein